MAGQDDNKTNGEGAADNNEIDPTEDTQNSDEIVREEYDFLDSKLDELNSALDFLEQKNDDIHEKLKKLLQSNIDIKEQLKNEKLEAGTSNN